MEQSLVERKFKKKCFTPFRRQHDGAVNNSGSHFHRHPLSRSWIGQGGASTIAGSSGGGHLRRNKVRSPICLDNLRGACAHGAFCKFHHADIGEHGGSKFYQSDNRSLGVADLGSFQLHTENKNNDLRPRFANAGYTIKKPCYRFQSGTCYNGASCRYLHSDLVQYDTPTHSASVEPQQVHGAVRVSGLGEGRNSGSRIPQGQEEANKKNNLAFSIGRRSNQVNTYRPRSDLSFQHHQRHAETVSNPACSEAHCDVTLRTFHGHDKLSHSQSPCRNFFLGKCFRGESCFRLHSLPMNDRIRYAGSAHTISRVIKNHEYQENWRMQPSWDMQVVYQENQARSTDDGMQLTGNRENIDLTSRSWSSGRHKSSDASDSGGNKLIQEPEVCIRFTKGRCKAGDSCSYLHGYHNYATSHWSTRPTEVATNSRNSGVANQHASIVMGQQYDGLKNSIVDQKGDASVMDGQICVHPEKNTAGICSSALGHEEISLWSRPFKRRRSQSISPLTPGKDNHCMNLRKDDSRLDLSQGRRYDIAQFHFPDRRSQTFERSMYHANRHQCSTALGTSINTCHHENYDSKSVGLQRHDDMVNQGLQIASASKNDEIDSATLALPPLHSCHIDQFDKELGRGSITADRSLGAAAGCQKELKLDPASSFKEQFVSPESFSSTMLEKEGNVGDSNENTADVRPSLKTYSRKNKRKMVQGSVSCEETMKKGASNTSKQQDTGSINEYIEQHVDHALATAKVSQRKLLVLDVNGLLVDVVSKIPKRCKPDTRVSGKGVFKRPFCDEFLQFCFERYDVGIWSSRTKKNLTRVMDFLMKDTKSRLLFCWHRSHCTLTGYNTIADKDKPLVLKELKKLWDNKGESLPWKKGYYHETNTILLDDSPYKALRNPPYTAIFPHPYTCTNAEDKSLGPGGDIRMYLERLAEAENVQNFIQENPFGQRPITQTNLSWAFYAKIIGSEEKPLEQKTKVVGSDKNQIEEKAIIVATSNGNQSEQKDEIVGTLEAN